MAVRIGKFGMSWLQPAGQAADLLVEAGRAKGAGLAALGQGIGQGIQAFGQNRRAERVREQDLALREQSRQDALAERAADNARQDAEFSMRQDAWKVEVLTANRDKAAQEAQMLAAAAQELGEPDLVQRAKAAESEAQRFGTALDTLLSSRMGVQGAAPVRGGGDGGGVQVGGKPMSQMTDAELNDLMGKSERGEVDYTYRGGATGDMGQGVGTNAPSAAPMPSASMVNDGGVMSGGAPDAPMASAPSMPQVDPRDPGFIKAQAEYAIKTIDEKFAKYAGKKRDDGTPVLSAKTRNGLERQRLDAVAALSYAESELQKRKREQDVEQVRAEASARKAADVAEEQRQVAEWNAAHPDRKITSTREIGPQYADQRLDQTQAFTKDRDASKQTFATQRDLARNQAANARQERSIAFKERWNKRKEDIAVKYKDAALAAQATQQEIDNQKVRMQAAESNYVMLRKQYDDGRDPGEAFYGTDTKPSAYDKYQDEMEKYMAMTDDDAPAPSAATATAPAATGGGYPSWLPPEEKAAWDAMPDSEKAKAIEKAGR
jgi:hypothetical protein